MRTVSQVQEELMAAPMTFSFVVGEVQELVEEIRYLRLSSIWEEWNDVMFCLLLWGLPYTGNLPMLPGLGKASEDKLVERLKVWKEIFHTHNLVFDKKYLVAGSNYKKEAKIQAALLAARQEQS